MAPPTLSQPGVNAVSVNLKALGKMPKTKAQPAVKLPSSSGGQAETLQKEPKDKVTEPESAAALGATEPAAKGQGRGKRGRKNKHSAPNTAPAAAHADTPEGAPLRQAQVSAPETAEQPLAAEAVAPVYPDVNFSNSDDLRLLHLHQETQLPGNLSDYGTDFNGGVLDDEDGEESQWRGLTDEEEKAQTYDLGFELLAHHAQIAFYGEDFSYLKKQDRPRTRTKKYCDTCLTKKQLALFAKDDDEVDMIDTCQKCHEDIQQDEAFCDFWPTNETPTWSTSEQIRAKMLVFGNMDLVDYEPVEA